MEPKVIDLYEFLVEAELQHYYNCIRNELKITTVAHLKYATDEDLKQIGLSRPEIRRMRKFYEKYFPHGYLSKIKRLLQNPKKDEAILPSTNPIIEGNKTPNSPNRIPNNKHIIPTDSICVNKQLGVGEFGIVQQGVWTNGSERIQVAIKCLCRERMISNPMDFLKEAAIMHAIEHENIVRLYGVVLDTDSLMLVTELAPLRSLLECLKDSSLRVNFLTVPTLCEFAMQICNGMMYLENKRLIHRDLAARNILVFSKNKVKISDFGLSKALGAGKDYYTIKFSPALKLPIAWCAPECINFLRFTSASDVWAYGVCLWEIFSYGFQPWAALTGQQILEAIDHPNCQRLEQPDCCPKEYYALMLKCWTHVPEKRPKFCEIYNALPDNKPEQLKTIVGCNEAKKDHLMYRQGEIITVLDKTANSPFWKGVLNSGKTGLFNPANTVAHLEGLPCSNNRDTFSRTLDRSSKRKLRTEMISKPQNDLKHTGHVGLDGAYFGDVSFLSNPQNYNHLPRQIVTPYKPSEDLEQTPLLLPPTPTSPDSTQTASGYFSESTNPSFVHSIETTINQNTTAQSNTDTPKHNQNNDFGISHYFDTIQSPKVYPGSNPFITNDDSSNSFHIHDHQFLQGKTFGIDLNDNQNRDSLPKWSDETEGPHEYHEISDDEVPAEKIFDGPSLLDEMDYMFRSMSSNSTQQKPPQSPDFDHTNKRNEITELATKLQRKNNNADPSSSTCNIRSKKNKCAGGTIKQISHKDEKILNQAIEIANEISARSMTDIFSTEINQIAQSPKRKFSFKFPHLSTSNNLGDKDLGVGNQCGVTSNSNTLTHSKERKNFTEELKNVSDLQNTITEQHRLAYNSLVEKTTSGSFSMKDEMKMATLPGKTSGRWRERMKEEQILPIEEKTMRPTTLPYRSSLNSSTKENKLSYQDSCDSNPLRKLRDKNFPLVRPRLKTLPNISTANMLNEFANCESPSYLTNTECLFSEKDGCIQNDMKKNIDNPVHDSLNPIPLPPRDKNKIILTNPKRHVRKHPLIIPGTGVQRTLNRVTQESPTDENFSIEKSIVSNNNYNVHPIKQIESSKLKDINVDQNMECHKTTENHFRHQFIENNFPNKLQNDHRTYANIEDLQNNMDTASLHFESILENDINQVNDTNAHDVVDSSNFGDCFDIHKEHIEKSKTSNILNNQNSDDESRNLDIEKKKLEFSLKNPKYAQQSNELESNLLFNKIKTTVDMASTSTIRGRRRSQNDCSLEDDEFLGDSISTANDVSCEDLLEFANEKPNGRERGVDSDEVRIMSKVLGKTIIPEECLLALDAIDWDVHKAIKICKLQNIMGPTQLSIEESSEALQRHDWDLQKSAFKLKKV